MADPSGGRDRLDEIGRRALRIGARAATGDRETWKVVIALLDELERTEGDLAVAVREAGRLRAFTLSLLTLETDMKARAGAGLGTIIDQARAALADPAQPADGQRCGCIAGSAHTDRDHVFDARHQPIKETAPTWRTEDGDVHTHADWCRYHDVYGCASQPRVSVNYNPWAQPEETQHG